MYWLSQAPSNIALIKYMGKQSTDTNRPDNASLSYTLNHLLSTVKLTAVDKDEDYWLPLNDAIQLNLKGQARFINHLQGLKQYFDYKGHFLIQSTNNFPQSSGLASSASSFAALTSCAIMALSELTGKDPLDLSVQAQLSRLGSGSSCRSFYSPWVLWQEESVLPLELNYPKLIHQVVIISNQEKDVSSSNAHQRVKKSPLYASRPQRAEKRLQQLLEAFKTKDWGQMHQVCWDEFQDMHELFHTCEQPFSYITKNSQEVLLQLKDLWHSKGDGPLITMDAGPNIHLLYRLDQNELAKQFKSDYLMGHYDVL